MPSLRDVRQNDGVAVFCSFGGAERTGKGSHRVVKMPNGRVLSIPAGIVKIGLLKSLIKAADLTEEEFEARL